MFLFFPFWTVFWGSVRFRAACPGVLLRSFVHDDTLIDHWKYPHSPYSGFIVLLYSFGGNCLLNHILL